MRRGRVNIHFIFVVRHICGGFVSQVRIFEAFLIEKECAGGRRVVKSRKVVVVRAVPASNAIFSKLSNTVRFDFGFLFVNY
jgi:hypothetical protein